MKIIFCIYQLDFADHISLAYLSAIAKNRGHLTYFTLVEELEEEIIKIQPDIVAYSLNIFGMEDTLKIHREMKEKYIFKSIAGGPGVTFNPQSYDDSGVDTFCMGEGEEAFDEYLSKIENNESFDNVLNLITKNGKNAVRPWIKDLNSLPIPDRDITLANSYLKHSPKKTFYTTRGCPFSCYYCANNFYNALYKGSGKIVRRFSVDRIINEIKYVRDNYTTNFIKFGDDVFALKVDDWLKEFADRYKNEINIPFNCYLRFDRVDEELLKILRDAGLHSVNISVDSTSEHVREKILGRKMRNVNITKQLKLINSFGIKTLVNFMLAAPESTLENDMETIDLGYKAKVTYTAYTTTVPINGTRLYEYSLKHNLIDSSYVGDMFDCFEKSPYKGFSEKEKDIRYNIYLIGSVVAKLPNPFRYLGKLIIRIVPPNKLFLKIKMLYSQYNIEKVIFKFNTTKRK